MYLPTNDNLTVLSLKRPAIQQDLDWCATSHSLHIKCSPCSSVGTVCVSAWTIWTRAAAVLHANPRSKLEPEQTPSQNFLQQLLMREAVGTDIGSVITNHSHRCRPFFTEGLCAGNPQKSPRLLLDVWWGWNRECTGKPCPLIKEGGSHRHSHYTADSRRSHLLEITKGGI